MPEDVLARLVRDPVVQALAALVADTPRTRLVEHGKPAFEFVVGANREYAKRGGAISPLPFTAVADAILQVLGEVNANVD